MKDSFVFAVVLMVGLFVGVVVGLVFAGPSPKTTEAAWRIYVEYQEKDQMDMRLKERLEGAVVNVLWKVCASVGGLL